MDIASSSAKAVTTNPASGIPGATATVPSASSIKPRSGSITTWRDSSQGCTSSSPFPSLRPYARFSARIHASSLALKRLAQDERFIGTDLPGFPGLLHTWGKQLQYHPHLHYIVPGGGLAQDRTTWRPSRANFFVPVQALSPIYRTLFKDDMRQAGLLEHIDPQVWTIPWHVPSQAGANGHTACTSLGPLCLPGRHRQ